MDSAANDRTRWLHVMVGALPLHARVGMLRLWLCDAWSESVRGRAIPQKGMTGGTVPTLSAMRSPQTSTQSAKNAKEGGGGVADHESELRQIFGL